MSEHELQNSIMEWLKIQGCYPLRINSGKIQNALTGTWIELCPRGTPDIITSRPDKTWGGIEVKSESGSLSMDQITTLRMLDAKGLAWLVADDLEDVDKWFHDPSYHGKEKHMKALKDKFAYSAVPYRKKGRLTMNQFLEFERFSQNKNPR